MTMWRVIMLRGVLEDGAWASWWIHVCTLEARFRRRENKACMCDVLAEWQQFGVSNWILLVMSVINMTVRMQWWDEVCGVEVDWSEDACEKLVSSWWLYEWDVSHELTSVNGFPWTGSCFVLLYKWNSFLWVLAFFPVDTAYLKSAWGYLSVLLNRYFFNQTSDVCIDYSLCIPLCVVDIIAWSPSPKYEHCIIRTSYDQKSNKEHFRANNRAGCCRSNAEKKCIYRSNSHIILRCAFSSNKITA